VQSIDINIRLGFSEVQISTESVKGKETYTNSLTITFSNLVSHMLLNITVTSEGKQI